MIGTRDNLLRNNPLVTAEGLDSAVAAISMLSSRPLESAATTLAASLTMPVIAISTCSPARAGGGAQQSRGTTAVEERVVHGRADANVGHHTENDELVDHHV